MTALDILLRLLQVYGKISGHHHTHLVFYNDYSGSVLHFNGDREADFDSPDEAKEVLINLILEAVG